MSSYLPCLLLLVSGSSLWAQRLLWEDKGIYGGYSFGAYGGGQLRVTGDVDGDGYPDFLCLGGDVGDPFKRPLVLTVSGREGGVLHRSRLGPPLEWTIAVAAMGDVDADGILDYAVTLRDPVNPYVSYVEVRRGDDDHVLWRLTGDFGELFGYSIVGGEDLNGDGRPDLAVHAPREGWPEGWPYLGAVRCFDHTGAPLWKRRGTRSLTLDMAYYEALSRVGDVDGDGCADVAVGGANANGGTVVILSGRDGSILTVGRPPSGWRVGWINAPVGDIDGDGVPDIGSVTGGDLAVVMSGRTGAVIWSWLLPGDPFTSIAGDIDLDRDGVVDIVIGSGINLAVNRAGRVYGFSGRDGTELFRIDNTDDGSDGFGSHVVPLHRPTEFHAPSFFASREEAGGVESRKP